MENLPALAPEADPAVQAFARLGEKVDLLEAAIAGLAAKREAAPDYSETLGEIAALQGRMRDAINTLARKPAMELTPDALATQVAAAGAKARVEDSAAIAQARGRIDSAASHMERLAGVVATAREQRRRLLWAAGGGLLAGMLLWSFLPGVILRALPQRWHMPESMATHIIGEPTLWEAGARLMQADSPQAWRDIAGAYRLWQDNELAIAKCRKRAGTKASPINCTIKVTGESRGKQPVESASCAGAADKCGRLAPVPTRSAPKPLTLASASAAVRTLPCPSFAIRRRSSVFAAVPAMALACPEKALVPRMMAAHSVPEGSAATPENRGSPMTNSDRILRLPTVLARTGLSRSTLYRKIAEGTFPRQVQISIHGAGWYESEINIWIADPVRYGREQKVG